MPETDDIQLQKLPPQNIEAEQMVLGAVLIDGGQDAISSISGIVGPEDFYKTSHKKIFEAMLRMSDANEPIDLITLPNALRGGDALEAAGGSSYLALLVSLATTSANIVPHARIVREKAILRGLIKASSDIIAKSYDDSAKIPAADLLDRAEQAILAIDQKHSDGMLVPMHTSVSASFAMIEKRYEQKDTITGIPTGFVDLDGKTSGLQQQDLIIIAGRPSMGKTAFALNIAAHAAIEQKKKIAIFSLEMSREQLTMRMIGSEARVDAHRIRTGHLQDCDWMPLSHASGRLAESSMHIDDTAAISAAELRARARRLKSEKGLDLIIVDYLQLMRGRGDEGNREQEISGISRSLKALAKELGIPIIALSQLNRALENRAGKDRKPQLSDLRESGAIEQDADVILFLYREEVYNKCGCPGECICGRRGIAELIIGKQRNGPIGKVDLTFLSRFTRFENKAG